jgi:uncharacterized membrane-anchored protein
MLSVSLAALGATFFHASSPTHANETLLLLGGNASAMAATTFVRLCALGTSAGCALLPNVQPSDASAQVVLPADPDGHAAGLERIQDLGIGAMTFPAAGSPTDLALLLIDHHGASLIVTAGQAARLEEFFDRSRAQSNPSTFLTRLKVSEKLVDAKAVATLYRSHISGGAVALLVMAVLLAIIAALWVSRSDAVVIDWLTNYWHRLTLWVQNWVT